MSDGYDCVPENTIMVEVLGGSTCSGMQWAHCYVVKGSLDNHGELDTSGVHSDCSANVLSRMVVVRIPAEMHHRAQLAVGSQLVIYRPWLVDCLCACMSR